MADCPHPGRRGGDKKLDISEPEREPSAPPSRVSYMKIATTYRRVAVLAATAAAGAMAISACGSSSAHKTTTGAKAPSGRSTGGTGSAGTKHQHSHPVELTPSKINLHPTGGRLPRLAALTRSSTSFVPIGPSLIYFDGTHSATGTTSPEIATAGVQALRLFDQGLVPEGAAALKGRTPRLISAPPTVNFCGADYDYAGEWRFSGTKAQLTRWLTSEIPGAATRTVREGAIGSQPATWISFVAVQPSGKAANKSISRRELIYSWATSGGRTLLRLDAIVAPAGETCINPGGPAHFVGNPIGAKK